MDNKIFHISLIVSLIVHLGVLAYMSKSEKELLKKSKQKLEVTYERIKVQPEEEEGLYQDLNVVQESNFSHKVEILDSVNKMFSPIGESIGDISKMSTKIEMNKKMSVPVVSEFVERTISVPVFKSEKMTNPKYLSYNQNIRQKIRRQAYHYDDQLRIHNEAGEVYMSFVLTSSGRVRRISVNEVETQASEFLRRIGKRSIQEAGPFPPFPKDLDYPELTFNIVITFKLR